jgi:hypothetical protein
LSAGSIDSIWFTAGWRLWEASSDAEERASGISRILEIIQLPLQLRDGLFQLPQARCIR